MLWCCIEPQRIEKTTPIMDALAAGFGGRTCLGEPPDDGELFIVWGQMWTALSAIQKARRHGRPYLQLDNGFIRPGRGTLEGYYRISYCAPGPILWPEAPPARLAVHMQPWRSTGRQVVIGVPGEHFGRAWGLDMPAWTAECVRTLRRYCQRPVVTRIKKSPVPLQVEFHNAWAVYTHSSNIAVDAVIAGVPVFCAQTCPAAPVGCLDVAEIERPLMPERQAWLNSLMAQQYTVDEMRSGLARDFIGAVIRIAEERRNVQNLQRHV